MKTFSKKTFTKVLSAFRLQFKNINDMASVKRGRALVGIMVNTIPLLGLHTTSAKVISVVVFFRLVYHLLIQNGAKGALLPKLRDFTGPIRFRIARNPIMDSI